MNYHSCDDHVAQLVVYPRSQAYRQQAVNAEEFYSLAALADFDPGMVENVGCSACHFAPCTLIASGAC